MPDTNEMMNIERRVVLQRISKMGLWHFLKISVDMRRFTSKDSDRNSPRADSKDEGLHKASSSLNPILLLAARENCCFDGIKTQRKPTERAEAGFWLIN